MPKCGKFGAASTAGWGAGAAIFSPVGRVVLLQGGGSPPLNPPPKPRYRSFSMLLTLAVWQVFTFFQFVLVQGEDLNFDS